MAKKFRPYDFIEIVENREKKRKQNMRFRYLLNEINKGNKYASDSGMQRISDCGSFLEFSATKDLSQSKVTGANFCCTRFCPHCAFNKSKKDAMQLYVVLEYLYPDYEFIFLTLTAPNVTSDELENELQEYSKAFDKLRFNKRYKNVVKGYFRKMEVTYNSHSNTYHPHYHVLLAVDKDYFKKDAKGNYSEKYIKQKEWLEMWKKAKKDDNIKILDVRRFDKEKDTSVLEITKYIAKDSDYLHNAEVFETFYSALKGKRYYSAGGVIRQARIKFNNGELDYLIDEDTNNYIYKIWYQWNYADRKYKRIAIHNV